MSENVLYILDIGRYLLMVVILMDIFLRGHEAYRDHLPGRIVVCVLGGMAYSATYVLLRTTGVSWAAMIVWWALASVVVLAMVGFCYRITLHLLLYYGTMVFALEGLYTILFEYWLCKLRYPEIKAAHPGTYLVLLAVTALVYAALVYLLFARGLMRRRSSIPAEGRPATIAAYVLIQVLQFVMNGATRTIFEWSNGTADLGDVEFLRHTAIPYYCIGATVIFCFIVALLLLIMYDNAAMQQERETLVLLQREREQQYEFNKENIALINAKCHDLKHQIRALASVSGEDRQRLFAETEQAIGFYDAYVKTGNSALDTILTEKGMLCAKYDIRFSCNVQAPHIDRIDVIDLYTILGNILDNAIECVRQYEDKDKRVISLSILEKGSMLNVFADNYYDGTLELRDGLPVTSKADKNYHGYGVRSVRMIAQKYGGDMRISAQNRTFSMQVMMQI